MEREEGREERAENIGLRCVAVSLGVPKVWKSEPRKLQNEVLRRPKAAPEASWRPEVLLGRFGDAPWALSGLLWELLGPFWVRFWVLWGTLGMLLGCFSGCRARATAKTPKTLN